MSLPVAIALTRRLALLVCRCGDAVGGAFLPGKIVALFFYLFLLLSLLYICRSRELCSRFIHASVQDYFTMLGQQWASLYKAKMGLVHCSRRRKQLDWGEAGAEEEKRDERNGTSEGEIICVKATPFHCLQRVSAYALTRPPFCRGFFFFFFLCPTCGSQATLHTAICRPGDWRPPCWVSRAGPAVLSQRRELLRPLSKKACIGGGLHARFPPFVCGCLWAQISSTFLGAHLFTARTCPCLSRVGIF